MVATAAGGLGFSAVVTQLSLMREVLGSFAGNEMVLGLVLGWWLLLMGAGAWLGRWPASPRKPLTQLAVLQIALALLPLAQVFLLRALRNVVFLPGSAIGMTGTAIAISVVLLPYCVPAGYALTLACRVQAGFAGSTGVGQVYVADSLGSVAGGIAFTLVLAHSLDHLAILLYPAWLNLLSAAALATVARAALDAPPKRASAMEAELPYQALRVEDSVPHQGEIGWGPLWAFLAAIGSGLGLGVVAILCNLDALSTSLQYPRQHILARANSPYGKLLVTESAGQINFLENGVPLTSSRDDQHIEETVHYALSQRLQAKLVLLIAGGVSGSAREILKYPVQRVDYVELDPVILTLARKFIPENLADTRIRLVNTDGRLFLTESSEKYDLVIIDLPAPSTVQLNRFYTVEFFAAVKRALTTNGVVSFALGQYENYVSAQLAPLLASAHTTLRQRFANVRVIPGGRVFFLGSDGPLSGDIAGRLSEHRIATRLVQAHYLEAMLAPDRLADLERAVGQPGELNRDFKPVLYHYYLRHWLSQFNSGWHAGPVVVAVLCGIYFLRLRGGAMVLFASGFAASSLELVLLLAFQILCGSVYHQVAMIVTVFMAGLAWGAWLVRPQGQSSAALSKMADSLRLRGAAAGQGNALVLLALFVAAFAVLLPIGLPLLTRVNGSFANGVLIKASFALLTLLLAVLVGMQFPLANRLEFAEGGVVISRLYTADFLGAFVGALLASTLLMPLLGLTGVCWLTALLNLVSGLSGKFGKWDLRCFQIRR